MAKWKTKTVGCIIAISIICQIISIPYVGANEVIGTNLALGSPLLNDSFKNDSWNKWEIIVFGVFLSNFAYPLIDDYTSTFSNVSYGSRGAGFKALEFGTGRDPNNNKVIKDLLEYVIAMQRDSRNLREIYVKNSRYIKIGNGLKLEKESDEEYTEATINNFFPEALKVSKFMSSDKLDLPSFAIKTGSTENESSMSIIFSYADGWDTQMLAAWMSRVSLGNLSKDANKALDKMLENDTKLYLDVFGNIVTINGDRNCIIFPASSNQYITRDKRYNLLTSNLFGGNYLTANGNTIVDKLESKRRKLLWWEWYPYGDDTTGVDSSTSKKYLKPGSAVLTYDSALARVQTEENRIREILENNEESTNDEGSTSESSVESTLNGAIFNKVLLADIDKKNTSMGFTIDIIGLSNLDVAHERFKDLNETLTTISNAFPTSSNRDKLTYIIDNKGVKNQIFDRPILTCVNIQEVDDKYNNWEQAVFRRYINFIQGYVDSGDKLANSKYAGAIDSAETLVSKIGKANSDASLAELLLLKEGKVSPLLAAFIEISGNPKDTSALFKKSDKAKQSIIECGLDELKKAGYVKRIDSSDAKIDKKNMETALSRVIKVYPYNSDIVQASRVMCVRQGTDFGLYSPYLYLTYLEFYGVTGGSSHNFNTVIFNENSDILKMDISKVTAGVTISEEDKKQRILDYSLMLLDPEEGREYRSDMAMSNFTDWIYRTYQNMVYGRALEYNESDGSRLSSRQTPGFLSIDNLSENFMTGWFVDKYSKYLLMLIGIGVIITIVVAILKKKKFMWVVFTILAVVTMAIITPTIGEIVPYASNNIVQGMFKDKMSYWAISESVTNAGMEAGETNMIRQAEESKLSQFIKMLNIVYLDRSLMIKNDISKKITETQLANYEEIQSMQSTRWMLPILIRQFSNNDGSTDYLYVPLADVYDNLSNLYWFYNAGDAMNVNTAAARDMASSIDARDGISNQTDFGSKAILYRDYIDTSNDAARAKGIYNNLAISNEDTNYSDKPGWESLSRLKDDSQVVHSGSYILKKLEVPSITYDYSDWNKYKYKDTWKKYAQDNIENTNIKSSLLEICSEMECGAGRYSSREPSRTIQDFYGYLWFTESPFHYFYQVIKDTFEPGITVGTVAGELQGVYEDNRETIMHYKDTGKVRDFLDMQELFTNTIPYMYKVQLLSGGYDGKSGLLEGEQIKDYVLYDSMGKSWLFRSNWVTKLMNSDSLCKKSIVTDRNNNKYNILNPMDPSTYPDERPMIFSEAQMYAQGLTELDLSIPELKILKVNNNVMKKWTICLNYVNIRGMTTEVLYRHMALDAVTEFNREFSPYNKVNSSKALYPTGVDLRSISFDSVMKMLMLNCTRDSNYIYGDTMKRVIENSDVFSAILLLIMAFLCTFIMPLIRNVLIGVIFFLCIYAIGKSIILGSYSKAKLTAAYIINNVLFLVMTIVYYAIFAVIVNSTYRDDVLSISNVGVKIGTPTWIFIIIIIISVAYIYGAYYMIKFVVRNRSDLGFEAYGMWTGILADKIMGSIDRLNGRGDVNYKASYNYNIDNNSFNKVNLEGSEAKVNNISSDDKDEGLYENYEYWNMENEDSYEDKQVTKDIEEGIKKGKKLL